MDYKKIPAGYPCSKFIVRKITNEDELWYYCKTFVRCSLENELDMNLIVSMLIASLGELNESVKKPDFNNLGNTPEEICQSIVDRKTKSEYKSCENLYRKIEHNVYACKMCPYSKGKYANKNEDVEWAIFKYMLQSEENYDSVMSFFTYEYFETWIEVSMGIPCEKSQPVQLVREFIYSASKENLKMILFDQTESSYLANIHSPFDLLWQDAFNAFPNRRKLSKTLKNNPMWENVLKTYVLERLESTPLITKEQFEEIADSYVRGEADATDVLEDNSLKGESTTLFELEEPEPAEEEKAEPVKDETASEEEPSDVIEPEKPDSNKPIDKDKNVSDAQYQVFLKENLILNNVTLPVGNVSKRHCLNLGENVPQPFIQGTHRDKQLPVEVVLIDGKEVGLLMYSRHLKLYPYCSIKNIPVAVKKLLTGRSIEKICFTPYLLYGLSKLYSLEFKNVVGLNTLFSFMVPETKRISYMSFVNSFGLKDDKLSWIKNQDTRTFSGVCPYIKGLPYYRAMRKIISNGLTDANPAAIQQRVYLDEALGNSYLLRTNFQDNGFAFIMPENDRYIFKETFNKQKINEGRFISYYAGEDMSELFNYILYRLAEKGIFRKLGIQVIGKHNQDMLLFVHKDCEDYIQAMIELIIFEYGRYYKEVNVNCLKYTV